jgi:hypothetical protein
MNYVFVMWNRALMESTMTAFIVRGARRRSAGCWGSAGTAATLAWFSCRRGVLHRGDADAVITC